MKKKLLVLLTVLVMLVGSIALTGCGEKEQEFEPGTDHTYKDAMVPFDSALNSCTLNPARCLGVDDRKGQLGAGFDADIVVLEDDYAVCQTYCRGVAML